MNCPKCGGQTRVWKTEKYDAEVERTRVCSVCGTGFKTTEEISEVPGDKLEKKHVCRS